MTGTTYRYTLAEAVPAEEIGITLLLARIGVEALHGESQARLDADHALDADARTVAIDASTEVGRDLNKLFAGFLAKEFGPDSFTVERGGQPRSNARPEPVTA